MSFFLILLMASRQQTFSAYALHTPKGPRSSQNAVAAATNSDINKEMVQGVDPRELPSHPTLVHSPQTTGPCPRPPCLLSLTKASWFLACTAAQYQQDRWRGACCRTASSLLGDERWRSVSPLGTWNESPTSWAAAVTSRLFLEEGGQRHPQLLYLCFKDGALLGSLEEQAQVPGFRTVQDSQVDRGTSLQPGAGHVSCGDGWVCAPPPAILSISCYQAVAHWLSEVLFYGTSLSQPARRELGHSTQG